MCVCIYVVYVHLVFLVSVEFAFIDDLYGINAHRMLAGFSRHPPPRLLVPRRGSAWLGR